MIGPIWAGAAFQHIGIRSPFWMAAGVMLFVHLFTAAVRDDSEPNRPPVRVGTSIGDITAALFTVIGILSALRHRDGTGSGIVDIFLAGFSVWDRCRDGWGCRVVPDSGLQSREEVDHLQPAAEIPHEHKKKNEGGSHGSCMMIPYRT